jgi:MFS family permease
MSRAGVRPAKQGGVLGVYGMGNIGQSAAVFLGPLLAAAIGWEQVFTGLAGALFIWAVIFWMFARDAPAKGAPKGIGDMVALLMRERLAWVLSAFYFLTFGGFVAFAIYLPTLLKDDFGLTPADAGFRAAGFVILATLLRPVGGALADKIGGARVLNAVFIGVIPFALLLSWKSMIPFTVGALGCAALLGLGNGAVFKLVPQYFPNETGAVTGLVGAMGGLGGFFPPLLLGFFRDRTGEVWPGFVLLAATSFGLFVLNRRVLLPKQEALELNLTPCAATDCRSAPRRWLGHHGRRSSGGLDRGGLAESSELRRRACDLHLRLRLRGLGRRFPLRGVAAEAAHPDLLQARVRTGLQSRAPAQPAPPRRRDLDPPARPDLHPASFDQAMVDAPVPLLGLPARGRDHVPPRLRLDPLRHLCPTIRSRTSPTCSAFPTASFPVRTVFAWLLFHGLDIAAVLVLAGIALSLGRRMRDNSAMTAQSFAMDFFPLILLFAISVTGLALTASTMFLRGQFYGFLSILHAITVISALLYLPFGKFFHMFQRPAQLGVKLYQDAGEEGPGANCASCGERFASRMHIDDLNTALPELGFNYEMTGPARTWQEICPPCKRKTIARAQMRLKEESLG